MGRGTDVPGAVLITAALMVGVFTIVKPAAEAGWTAPRTLALGLLTLTLLAGFIVREATAANPLVPLRIFRSRNLTGANLIQALSASGMFGIFFLGSLYLQRVLGYDALEIGLAFLPTTVIMGLLSVRYSEKLVMRFGPRRPLIAGLVLIVVGLALFTQAPVGGNYVVHVLPVLILLGLGAGICFPALMGLSMADVKPEDAGLGLRPRRYHRPGRRRTGPGCPGHAVRYPHRGPGRAGKARAGGPDLRLPPLVRGRRRHRRRRRGDRLHPDAPGQAAG